MGSCCLRGSAWGSTVSSSGWCGGLPCKGRFEAVSGFVNLSAVQAPPSPDQQVRFCTEPYSLPASDNLDHVYAHLTNYAVNKHNAAFQFNQ